MNAYNHLISPGLAQLNRNTRHVGNIQDTDEAVPEELPDRIV
jgi:hypothetical protein